MKTAYGVTKMLTTGPNLLSLKEYVNRLVYSKLKVSPRPEERKNSNTESDKVDNATQRRHSGLLVNWFLCQRIIKY